MLKKINPFVKIVGDWKFGPEEKGHFGQLLEVIDHSKEIDLMEVHEKWGGKWWLQSGRMFEDWKKESPLYNGKIQNYMQRFYAEMKRRGRKVKLGMNEWRIETGRLTPSQCGLVVADYMIAMVNGDVKTACYWNLNIGEKTTKILQTENGGKRWLGFPQLGMSFKCLLQLAERGGWLWIRRTREFMALRSRLRGVSMSMS